MSSRPSIACFIGASLAELELCLNPFGILRKQPVEVLHFISTNKSPFYERRCFLWKFYNSYRSLTYFGAGLTDYLSRQFPGKRITPEFCRPLIALYLD